MTNALKRKSKNMEAGLAVAANLRQAAARAFFSLTAKPARACATRRGGRSPLPHFVRVHPNLRQPAARQAAQLNQQRKEPTKASSFNAGIGLALSEGNKMKKILLATIAAFAFAGSAQAAEFNTPKAGTVKLDVRFTGVIPDESGVILASGGTNGSAGIARPETTNTGLRVAVNNGYVPTIGLEYYFSPNVSLEVIAGTAKHTVSAVGTGVNVKVAEVWHVPPTLTAKYHFAPEAQVSPYIGAGLTYIWFASEKGLNGFNVDLKDNWGYAIQGGLDIATTGPWSYNIDVKKIMFDTNANINFGAMSSKVTLDPWVLSIGFGYKFN